MKRANKLVRWLKITGFLILFIGGTLVYLLFFLPLPDSIIGYRSGETTKIYDRNGILLYEVLRPEEGRKTHLSFKQLPKVLIDATLAAEDSNFYNHGGVDIGAVLRAIWLNVKNQDVVSGGSTITQQLMRNLLGTTRDRSWYNKALESLYALRISNIWSKDEILERYFNTVYYGNLSYGAEAAAQSYFGKHIYDLDLAQISLLAGIPKNPSLYNPYTHWDDARDRQTEILTRMTEETLISPGQQEAALAEKIELVASNKNIRAPHFVYYVLDELENSLGREQLLYGGLKITTTLDIYLQEEAERIVTRQVSSLAQKRVTNGAVLAVDKMGEILIMVGSEDFFDTAIDGEVNVTLRKRQPGSTLKPITYLAAMDKGWTAATTIFDIPTRFVTEEGTPYTPQNYDMDFHGPVTVRDALANSYNIPAVKALQFAGSKEVLQLAKKLGITTLDKDADFYGLALTLGDGEVRLFDLVQAYTVLANEGVKRPLYSIIKSEPGVEELLPQMSAETILPKNLTYVMTHMLSDNSARLPSFGENSVLNILNVAAKTGTSRNYRDNWTIGYSPIFTVGVWVGNSDSSAMINVSGVDGAGPIFQDVAKLLIKNIGNDPFAVNKEVKKIEICLPSGKLPTADCPSRRTEVFLPGTEPKEKDTYWINQNGKLVMQLPPELQYWAKLKGYPVLTDTTRTNYLHIENPQHLDEFQIVSGIPRERQLVTLRVTTSTDIKTKDVEWFVNGVSAGKGVELPWPLREGNFTIQVKYKTLTDQVAISVGVEK